MTSSGVRLFLCLCLVNYAAGSFLTAPPQSAVVVAFEDVYDLSLLANTLSDEGIDATLIIPASAADELYENLVEVEVLYLNVNSEKSATPEHRALETCEALLKNEAIAGKIKEIQPTFTILPALRHDACLIPWAKHIDSIPVIWTRDPDEEVYVFQSTGAALPVQNQGFVTRLFTALSQANALSSIKSAYAAHALNIVEKYMPNSNYNFENLYSDVRLILRNSDAVLRSDFASLTQLLVDVGCHHCRGVHPLESEFQKSLVEHRLGTIAVLLDESEAALIENLAKVLPQGRDGQAVVWKNRNVQIPKDKPENLYINPRVDRQDLIGFGRTRVVLSHCADTELLEAAFHGTPVICFPRNPHETRNAARAVSLGFASSTDEMRSKSTEEVANTVTQIHELPEYRENGRKVSIAIRDRINPPVDRLIFWLRYLPRSKDGGLDVLTPARQVRTYNVDLSFFFGLCIGSILGVASAIACMIIRYVVLLKSAQKSKGRYKR